MGYRLQYRRDTAARWAEINPILLDGEIGYVKDKPNQYKMGDGVHRWNDLPLRGFDGTIAHTLGYDDNAVLSQRIVTEKFEEQNEKITELGSQVGNIEYELGKKTEAKPGKNLLNPNTCVKNTYIDATNGDTGSLDGVYASDYIKVNGNNLYLNNASGSGAVIGWAAYDKDKKFTHGDSSQRYRYTYIDGDFYVRFSIGDLTKAQVEIGTYSTDYEEYNPIEGWLDKSLDEKILSISQKTSEIDSELNSFMDGFYRKNVFNVNQIYAEGKYCQLDQGHIVLSDNASFNTYILPVESGKKYSFNNEIRFVIPLASDRYTSTSETLLQSVSSIDLSGYDGTLYLAISFNVSSISPTELVISIGDTPSEGVNIPNWSKIFEIKRDAKESSKRIEADTINTGEYLSLGNDAFNASRKGERIMASMDIAIMGSVRLGFTPWAPQYTNYILIDSNKIGVFSYGNLMEEVHGLEVVNNLQIEFEQHEDAKAVITITSNGVSFSKEFAFVKRSAGYVFIKSEEGNYSNVKLSWVNKDINKKMWVFGDSYLAYSDKRWTYYLHEDGYDKNALLDGYPGEGSEQGYKVLSNIIQYGTPKFIVWGYGMNDGSDLNENSPSEAWVTYRDKFISICNSEGIIPIFATIPTVPNVNNEGKNKWVRNSGYRYVDYAKAVGANSNGVWYNGMLSSDEIHPAKQGALALYHQFITDVPEIMID